MKKHFPPFRLGFRALVKAPFLLALALVPVLCVAANAQIGSLTLTVNSTADTPDANPGDGVCQTSSTDGADCTLRAAIEESNARGGATINFRIPGAGVKVIAPGSFGLPVIMAPVAINGYSQPSSSQNTLTVGDNAVPLIQLRGINTINAIDALDFRQSASGSTIRGLIIGGFSGNSVQILAADITVQGCFIGTDATGTAADRNGFGVDVGYGLSGLSGNAQIGGTTAATRNIIADSIFLSSPLSNTIQGNYIGTDKTGNLALNPSAGISCSTLGGGPDIAGAVIGGPTSVPGTGAGNVISGNAQGAIRLTASGRKIGAFSIAGNIIGLNASGTVALPNAATGILVEDANVSGATGSAQSSLGPVTIGGTQPGAGNLISGNYIGILSQANGLNVQGNRIGTDITGTLARPNEISIALYGSFNAASAIGGRSGSATIGGASAAARNVIVGGSSGVIEVRETNATIQGNFIGVAPDGITPLGNNARSIFVGVNNAEGTVSAQIGGSNAGEGNLIENSRNDAVVVSGAASGSIRGNAISRNGNRGVVISSTQAHFPILGNTFFGNGAAAPGNAFLGLDIDLGGDGITNNDAGDADTGANGLQNTPVITGVAGQTITATLNSLPNTSFRVEFFAKSAIGQTFLGFVNATTNGSGNAGPFALAAPSNLSGTTVAATATRLVGSRPIETSEFSVDFPVGAVKTNSSTVLASSRNPSQAGQSVTFTATVTGAGGTPTGTVIFRNGTTQIGAPVTLVNGVATSSASTPAPGNNQISATYGGDATYNGSAGSLNQTVNAVSPIPSLSIANAQISEGNSGTKLLAFTVTATRNGYVGAITAKYNTANGTATAGSDYVAVAAGTLTIPAGQNTGVVNITINGDTTIEPNETLRLTLSAPSPANATFARATATGTIRNDDAAPALPTLSVDDVSFAEGNSGTKNFVFTVSLAAVPTKAVTVRYATGNGTATVGSDYSSNAGTLTFAPGVTSQTIRVRVIGDTLRESNETFVVNLSAPTNATVSKAVGTGTIQNDDFVADLSVTQSASPASVPRGGEVVFTITVGNNGPDAAQNVTISDVLPAGATLVSSNPNATTNANGTLTYSRGQLGKAGRLSLLAGAIRRRASPLSLPSDFDVSGKSRSWRHRARTIDPAPRLVDLRRMGIQGASFSRRAGISSHPDCSLTRDPCAPQSTSPRRPAIR